MKLFPSTIRYVCMGLACLCLSAVPTGVAVAQEQDESNRPVPLPDETINIRFAEKLEWKPLIEYYAERAGLSLQLVDSPPDGVFDYQSDRDMTMQEALDLINQMLITNDRVLIRNRDLLLLYNLTKGIPEDIIETVPPEELDQRGKYEIVKTIFDIKTLRASDLQDQFANYITEPHRSKFAIITAANEMIVQETVMNLLEIRRALDKAIANDENWDIASVDLKHVSPDEVLMQVPLIGVNRDTLASEDGTFRISIDPLAKRIFYSGDTKTMRRFRRLVETIDVAPEPGDAAAMGDPFPKSYPVRGDVELIFKVLQTMLSGRADVRLAFDDGEGQIILMGRQDAHDLAQSTIDEVQGSSEQYAVVDLKEFDPDEMVETLQALFKQEDGETTTAGPVFHADTRYDRIVIRGTPQEVRLASEMVAKLDIPISVGTQSQSPIRRIDLSPNEFGSTLDFFEQMWPSLGIENELSVERPGERIFQYDPKRRSFFEHYRVNPDDEEESSNDPPANRDTSRDSGSLLPQGNGLHAMQMVIAQRSQCMLRSPRSVSVATFQESTPAILTDQQEEDPAVPQIETIPGAPIRILITDYGLILESDDLDALDRIEDLLYEHLNAAYSGPNIVIFELKYRAADEAKSLLESYLGLSSGGGGGNPLGGIIGGAMSNAIGGPAGDMMSGLLGGGGGSSGGGIYEPEGEVAIVADAAHFTLAVSASPPDMEMIRQLIELIDQPELGQSPNPVGQTKIIRIHHRPPTEIANIVRTQLQDLIESEGGGDNPGQGQMEAQMLQAFLQGGGQGQDKEVEVRKGALSVDELNSSLVFTGPNYIYDQVMLVVRLTDVPTQIPEESMELVPMDGMDPNLFIQGLQQALRGKVKVIAEDGTETSGIPTATPNAGGNARGQGQPNFNANQLRQMMQRANRGRGGQGGARGGGGRGGGGRGGGGRGGGGRGR